MPGRLSDDMDALGRLAGGVAHEYDDLLAVVLSHAELLGTSLAPGDPRGADLAELRRAAERAAELTGQLLALGRQGAIDPRPLALDAMLLGLQPSLRRALGVHVELRVIDAGVPAVVADRGKLEQALLNLAVNARQAMPDGGGVTVELTTVELDATSAVQRGLSRPGRYAVVAVTDTGVGMDAETRRRAVEPFFTTRAGGPATGLGLSVVYGVVDQAGGALTIDSEPGRGSTVRIFLPAAGRAEVRPAVARTGPGRGRAPASTPGFAERPCGSVLVVDDDRLLRRTIVRALRAAGIDTEEADSGAGAARLLEVRRFDVVVSDLQMPDGGGLELLRIIRRIDLDIPVVLITGIPDARSAAEALEHGAFRYLTKPLDLAALEQVVRQAGQAHRLARIRREAVTASGASARGAVDRAGLEVRFDAALAELWMAFQPIVEARTGVLFGAEALLRTDEPSMPDPGAVLDAATELGRLSQLGRRVRALSAGAFAASGRGLGLFVNLHPDDLLDAELISPVSPLARIAPRVILEVTERASLRSSSALLKRITRLRELGFRLAVDDVGAGYSGLTSFASLTPEIVKIDMSLVRDAHLSVAKQRTIRALCNLCHESGSLVVAEGIETPAERDALLELGCDLFQGYLFGRPERAMPG